VARFRLIPREERFFEDFTALAAEIGVGARYLEEMLQPDPPLWDRADEIKEVEHRCDSITHEILKRLHRTFVTPLDREDIYAMARGLDDVMDAIDAAAGVVRRYRVQRVRNGGRELARVIALSTGQLTVAMEALERHDTVQEAIVEVNRLENEGDRIHHQAVEELFAEEKDPIEVIKWKEILDFLEEATDMCEDVANLLEGIVLKHA
jgi:predicted phosphate transport protein (TIGR00153 family)